MSTKHWHALPVVQKAVWVIFLVCLPVTSFPYFPSGFGGSTLVRPLSLYPLLVLLLLVTIPRLLSKPILKTLVAFMPFILVSIASATYSILRDIEPALGISVLDRTTRGLITLGVGTAIYFTIALFPRSRDELRATLRWIYTGFSLALLWGSMQIVFILKYIPAYFRKLNDLQHFISVRKLFQTRISGLTYEPNWFAEQISILLLPWLIASVFTGYTVFNWRWRKITIEWFLLAWAIANLTFTFSRAGFINLIILSVFGLLLFRRFKTPHAVEKPPSGSGWVRKLVEASLLGIVILTMIFIVGSKNTFFSRLWNFWTENKESRNLDNYLEYIGFGARIVYLKTALNIFDAYPILGVGPGNYAFYFDEMFPDQQLASTPELLHILSPEPGRDRLITPKNLYTRILAETGLGGISTFIVFILALLGCALYLWLSPANETRYWGIAGLLGLIVVVVSANFFDSFALPNMWVVFGLITAAASISDQEERMITSPGQDTGQGK